MKTFNELVKELGRFPTDKEWKQTKEAKEASKRGKKLVQNRDDWGRKKIDQY